jgi:F-type H+-transporting ATPase subunit gamma
VVVERLLPVRAASAGDTPAPPGEASPEAAIEFLFEPDKAALLERLVPMYVDVSILRALYESQASELGARMTAMDAATKNATEMINGLTLQYNKARQAAITKELMEIIGGSEALKE